VVDIVDGPRVAGIEGKQCVAKDVFVLAAKFAGNDVGYFFPIQFVNGAQHPEDKDVLATVFRRAADRLDRGGGEGHADVDDIALVFQFLHLVAVVETDPAVAQCLEVVVVGILIEGDECIRLITGMQDFSRSEMHLENGRSAGNRGWDGHVGHHLLRG
jgi:hypothetical protein